LQATRNQKHTPNLPLRRNLCAIDPARGLRNGLLIVLIGRNFGTLNDADFLQKNQVGARSPQPVPYLQKDFAAPVRPEALMGIQRQHPNSCR